MAEHTAISWADDTFNPWEGCQKVSPACDGCYAEARNLRYAPKGTEAAPNWGPGAPRRRTSASNWAKPLKWEREQALLVRQWAVANPGKPYPYSRFVFCASLADVFDNAVPVEWRRDLFDLIRKTPRLTWLLLTKRPGNIVKLFGEAHLDAPDGGSLDRWPRNAAIGCTVVTQEEADRDVPKLLAAKAALNPAFAFVSMEPLLGPVDIAWALSPNPLDQAAGFLKRGHFSPGLETVSGLDWVITGGETDQGSHKARPSHPDWFRSLRDQCAAAGVAYHHKQNGEWASDPDLDRPFVAHHSHSEPGTISALQSSTGQYAVAWTRRSEPTGSITEGIQLKRLGKKAAGRLLDGVTHDARPAVRA